MTTTMQQKRATASRWTSLNPILLAGEIGFETDTNKIKIGDVSTHWSDLSYIVGSGTSGSYQPLTTPINFAASSQTTWNITHSLPYQPSVTTIDTYGNIVEGSVNYVDSTHITITFSVPVAGYAYLA